MTNTREENVRDMMYEANELCNLSFVIQGTMNEKAYWNNCYGWVSFDEAERYTEQERHTLSLPVHGKWIAIDKDNVK